MRGAAVDLGLIGCGGMGRRHVHGLVELHRAVGGSPIRLVAVADRDPPRASDLAAEAERLLGRRPAVFPDQDALAASGAVEAVDITTGTESHADLCCAALERGLHVLVEKPLAVTVAECLRVQRAAERAGRVVAVAEQVRREAAHRLARAAIESGLLGDVRLVIDQACAGGDAILLTPWRHRKFTGGTLLDVMVHTGDLIEYLAGRVDRVAGRIRLAEPVRRSRGDAGPVRSASYYETWAAELPREFAADAEDEAAAVLQFRSGALGTWTTSQAAHGEPSRARWIYGGRGSLCMPPDRSGASPVFTPDRGPALEGQALVDAVPSYRLDALSAAVYGGARHVPSELPFPLIDHRIVAIELGDFADAVRRHCAPEVNAAQGTRNIALVWAVCEASVAGGWIDVAEVERGERAAYQATLRRV